MYFSTTNNNTASMSYSITLMTILLTLLVAKVTALTNDDVDVRVRFDHFKVRNCELHYNIFIPGSKVYLLDIYLSICNVQVLVLE